MARGKLAEAETGMKDWRRRSLAGGESEGPWTGSVSRSVRRGDSEGPVWPQEGRNGGKRSRRRQGPDHLPITRSLSFTGEAQGSLGRFWNGAVGGCDSPWLPGWPPVRWTVRACGLLGAAATQTASRV